MCLSQRGAPREAESLPRGEGRGESSSRGGRHGGGICLGESGEAPRGRGGGGELGGRGGGGHPARGRGGSAEGEGEGAREKREKREKRERERGSLKAAPHCARESPLYTAFHRISSLSLSRSGSRFLSLVLAHFISLCLALSSLSSLPLSSFFLSLSPFSPFSSLSLLLSYNILSLRLRPFLPLLAVSPCSLSNIVVRKT